MTRAQFLELLNDRNSAEADETTPEQQAIWFVAVRRAEEMADWSVKELAQLLMGGTKPMTIDDVDRFLRELEEDHQANGESMEALIGEMLDDFYGTV